MPPGVTGEVTITARHLPLGYHNNPELTATRYRRNPDGTTTYRGGDLGRFDADGVLHLRGRMDAAVKIGAYLVEPAEVEAALLDLPTVAEAVVSAVREPGPDGAPRPRLVAHVVPVAAEHSVTPAALRRALRERLPSWMVPARIAMLDALPRNERGKVDRTALPEAVAQQPFVGPRTPTEHVVAGVWQAVLGLDEVPVDADLWELGADSLAIERLVLGLRRAAGVTLTSADLANAPTVERLAAVVTDRHRLRRPARGERPAVLPRTAVQLREGTARPPVFAFAGGGAAALSLLPLAVGLRVDVPVVGFQAAATSRAGCRTGGCATSCAGTCG
ncbi:hypothetical protein BJF78_28685 [Pseudonocardia sp. CNS-139]|nr:hypothetical protein BJF78_28685 [Pseudonocardia sp. CNS-139]